MMPNPIYCTTICIRNHRPELLTLHLCRLSSIATTIKIELNTSQLKKKLLSIAQQIPNQAIRISITNKHVLGFEIDSFPIRTSPIQANLLFNNKYKKTIHGKERKTFLDGTHIYYDEQGILEGSWYTVFVENEQGCILTPPLGKIIAGTMRSAVLYTLHKMQYPYKIMNINPHHQGQYFATTALRILQPINQESLPPHIVDIQEKTKYFIHNNESDIFNFWHSEIQKANR